MVAPRRLTRMWRTCRARGRSGNRKQVVPCRARSRQRINCTSMGLKDDAPSPGPRPDATLASVDWIHSTEWNERSKRNAGCLCPAQWVCHRLRGRSSPTSIDSAPRHPVEEAPAQVRRSASGSWVGVRAGRHSRPAGKCRVMARTRPLRPSGLDPADCRSYRGFCSSRISTGHTGLR